MTDHSEFISKHHRQAIGQDSTHARNESDRHRIRLAIIATAAVSYLVLCLGIATLIGFDGFTVSVIALIFVGAFILAFLTQKLLNAVSIQEKERHLLHEVIEGSRGARLITDADDKTVYTNTKFNSLCKTQGRPGLETLTSLFSNNPDALSHFTFLADKAHRGLTDSIELQTRIDDREYWFSVTAQPVAGWAGYIHWRVDDVTDKMAAEKAVHEEREKLIDFTDNAPVGFFSVDEDGRFVFANATLARWLGEDIKNLLNVGTLHNCLVSPPEKAKPYQILDNANNKQMAKTLMKGHGGKPILVSINQTIVTLPDGKIRTRGVVNDLTSEEEMHKALKESEDRFQRFFEEAPLGVVMVSEDGIINDCNASFAALLGTTIKDVEGTSLKNLIERDTDYENLSATLDRIEEEQNMSAPIEVTLKAGEGRVTSAVYARKFKIDDDENIVLHFIDLTEQKSLEAQFVQSQKMQAIGQLAGGVAHDFNNLLTAMIGFCDLLLLRHKPGDPSFGDIMQIKQNSNRASNLVRQLLAFSRQQTLQPKIQDITDILIEVSNLLRRLLGPNIDLKLVHASNLNQVKVDEGQIEQVLINLAVNARDAMDNEGSLKIETGMYENKKHEQHVDDEMPPGQWVAINVTDTGSGIDDATMKRIFEPFFTTKEVGEGTGLGLATVHGIIRQTGGYLDVKSKVGKGTTFTIYLPAISEKEAESENKGSEQKQDKPRDLTGTATILLVEDEDAVRTFSSRALTNKGYNVLTAENGEVALDVINDEDTEHIDLLITDVIMPNMDGPTLAQRVRQKNKELKIIFISGYTEEKLKDQIGDYATFLPKPFTLQKLAETVKDVLDT